MTGSLGERTTGCDGGDTRDVEITLLPTRANNQSMGQTTVLQQQQRDQGVVRPCEFGFSYCVLSS
jgi:hypothetical protein